MNELMEAHKAIRPAMNQQEWYRYFALAFLMDEMKFDVINLGFKVRKRV